MNNILAQIIVARGNDEGWIQILIVVIMAVVYGLGTILKAKKGGKVEGQDKQRQASKTQRKPATGGRGVLEQFINEIRGLAEPEQERESRPPAQPARRQIAHPQPAVRKYTAEAKQPRRVQPRTPLAKPKSPLSKKQVQPDFEELPEFTSKTDEGLIGKRKGMPAEVVESRYLSEVLADFTDPEDLRMAILHYEILGRPLSLRDPSAQVIGL